MFAVMTMQRRAALSFLLGFLMVALSNAPFPVQALAAAAVVVLLKLFHLIAL